MAVIKPLSVRETIESLKAGSIKTVVVEPFGTFHFKRVSMAQMMTLPEKESGLELVALSACDELGELLFTSAEQVKTTLSPVLCHAYLVECHKVNSINVEEALKN